MGLVSSPSAARCSRCPPFFVGDPSTPEYCNLASAFGGWFIWCERCIVGMATAKTGSFYLTESVSHLSNALEGDRVQGSIDLGAYVNVPTGQAIAVESVDFIFQRSNGMDGNVESFLAGNGSLSVQLTDQNPATLLVQADDASLIASGVLNIDAANNIASHSNDMYPDNFGPAALSESFMVVNDELFLVSGADGSAVGTAALHITARIRCRVVKLSSVDWMAIAIQSTAND